jgi:UDP-N-acetylmuramoyl-tripeptide--D-alanyl-D-alanine ligase
MVADRAAVPAGASAVVVGDTLHAFGELAKSHRRRWGGRVVAITGSAGKTTTKELTHAALAAAGARAYKTEGNLNNLIGAPASLLCLDAQSELAVIEIGTNAPGEVARLAAICEPEVGVVTGVAAAHTAGLGSLELVAAEKASLLWALPASGAAIYRAEDAPLGAQLGRVQAQRRIGFGTSAAAAIKITARSLTAAPAMQCEFALAELGRSVACDLQLFGEGPALDAAAALAVVWAALGADALAAAASGLASVAPPPGRLQPLRAPGGALILDDSYNANPASMRVSIATAIELARVRGGRAVLVLGDMLELGALSRTEHATVGVLAAQREVAALIACGPEMTAAAETAREQSQVMLSIAHLGDPTAAPALIRGLLKPADVVLVKGSRGMGMERVVRELVQPGPAGRAP